MQEVKNFYRGIKIDQVAGMQSKPIEDQINEFLKEHTNYVARDIAVIVGPSYLEAYVIFDIKDEKKPQNGKNNGR